MKIAFHSNQLCLRGTEIALYTYADYNEKILGNESIIISNPHANMDAYEKFAGRFRVILTDFSSYETLLAREGVDFMYCAKMGTNDGLCLTHIPTLVHAVFRYNEPHGHRYRYVSDWLAKDQGYDPEVYSVPHIVEPLPVADKNLREDLGIAATNTVFGCYGGSTEFNIPFVQDAIVRTVEERKDVSFIFMNINQFCDHPQVVFLPGTWDMMQKARFVETCDAMIHARSGGETFGLAVSEFATKNKPVLTYGLSGEAAHLDIMGERAIRYNGYEEVYDMFNHLKSYIHYDDYDAPYRQFSPEIIMEKFKNRFLK